MSNKETLGKVVGEAFAAYEKAIKKKNQKQISRTKQGHQRQQARQRDFFERKKSEKKQKNGFPQNSSSNQAPKTNTTRSFAAPPTGSLAAQIAFYEAQHQRLLQIQDQKKKKRKAREERKKEETELKNAWKKIENECQEIEKERAKLIKEKETNNVGEKKNRWSRKDG